LTISATERTTIFQLEVKDMKELLDHQIEDAAFLASKSFAGNFSGMGSGKTLTALAAVDLVSDTVEDRAIIVCPPIAMNMWQREFSDFLGYTAQIVKTGKTKLDHSALAYILSYQIATKRRDELKELGAKVLILDESHALKSIKAKRTKAILGRGGLCESVDFCWALSGTPVTRWNNDIFSFLVRASNGLLKEKIGKVDADHFNLRYCIVQKRQFPGARFPTKMVVGNRNTEELNELIFDGGLAVRRELKEVWAAMPPITTTRSTISLSKNADLTEALAKMKNQTQAQIAQGIARNDESLSRTRRLMGMGKVEAASKVILERLESGAGPILVGCWHTDVIDALQEALQGHRVGCLDGRTSPKEKQRLQDWFNEGKLEVLIGQIAAMGVAIDLQHGGNNIICVEEDWSPALMDQFYARMHRMGQAKHVHVEILETDTRLDEAVRKIVARKRVGHNQIMEQAND